MKKRIISGLCMAPLLIVVFFGGWVLKIFAFVITIFALHEFFGVHKDDHVIASMPIAVSSVILLYVFNIVHLDPIYYSLWFMILLAACVLYLFNVDNRLVEDATLTFFGTVYIGFSLFHLAWMADFGEYSIFVWMVIICAIVTDIAAYFTGMLLRRFTLFGDGKLCPKISPKKTYIGAIGGVLFCALASFLFGFFFTDGLWVHCLIMGVIGSIAGQIGDLLASIFKRKVDVKDYGNLIPGHGGVMDRIDSLLLTAPVIAWYVYIVIM